VAQEHQGKVLQAGQVKQLQITELVEVVVLVPQGVLALLPEAVQVAQVLLVRFQDLL
jgi:hypothetical protein